MVSCNDLVVHNMFLRLLEPCNPLKPVQASEVVVMWVPYGINGGWSRFIGRHLDLLLLGFVVDGIMFGSFQMFRTLYYYLDNFRTKTKLGCSFIVSILVAPFPLLTICELALLRGVLKDEHNGERDPQNVKDWYYYYPTTT